MSNPSSPNKLPLAGSTGVLDEVVPQEHGEDQGIEIGAFGEGADPHPCQG